MAPYPVAVHGGGTLPLSSRFGQGYDTFPVVVVIRMVGDYTYGNEPFYEDIRKFKRLSESVLERRRRISREQKMLATSRLRRFGLPPLPEALFDKPTFVRRACGSRWRVMTP